MPPPLPKNTAEREEMWWYAKEQAFPVIFGDPEEPADHLEARTQSLIALFPEMRSILQPRFGYSRETDHYWFAVRPLGKGSFGGVAVWEKRDYNGVVVEETAVKQSMWSQSMASNSDHLWRRKRS